MSLLNHVYSPATGAVGSEESTGIDTGAGASKIDFDLISPPLWCIDKVMLVIKNIVARMAVSLVKKLPLL